MDRRKFMKLNSQMVALLSLMPFASITSCSSDKTSIKNKNMNENNLDVLIVGGGPAGMSAALVLGRSLMNVAIVNEEKPRNIVTQASHGFLTRDGYHPIQFLEIAKEQIKQYESIEYVKNKVLKISKEEDSFNVVLKSGREFKTKRVIFATGFKDNIAEIGLKGVEDVYAKSVFPCPFCDGWERRNEPLALFGKDAGVDHFAKTISNWTNDLIVFTNGGNPINAEQKQILKKNNIEIIDTEVDQLISKNGHLTGVKLIDGRVIKRSGGFLFSTGEQQATDIPLKLGVEVSDWGPYETNEWGKTKVEGVYIVGDAKNSFTGLIGAAAEGSQVAEFITQEIIEERWIR